jgi:hypothetical protein
MVRNPRFVRVSPVGSHARRDGGMQPTPLRGPKIGGILKTNLVLTAFPIYTAARLMGKPLGGSHSHLYSMQCV